MYYLCGFVALNSSRILARSSSVSIVNQIRMLGLCEVFQRAVIIPRDRKLYTLYRLFLQAKAIAEPFAYEEYRKKRIQEKLDEERANRVRLKVCRNDTVCAIHMYTIACVQTAANIFRWKGYFRLLFAG